MTKLDRLNALLRNPELNLPDHRRQVLDSGGNLDWLRKHLPRNPAATGELLELVGSSMHELLKG